MKVKRFTAPTMAEALKQVKGTLGPDAVILETTEAAGQVTVTAAVDLEPPAATPGAEASKGRLHAASMTLPSLCHTPKCSRTTSMRARLPAQHTRQPARSASEASADQGEHVS